MDAKVTLSFDKEIIEKAKAFAGNHNISLSRLTEYLFRKLTEEHYQNLEEIEVAEWVYTLAEGEAKYIHHPKSRKETKSEYYKAKK